MTEALYPILQYDPERQAILNPYFKEHPLPQGSPKRCVLTFFREVLDHLAETGRLRPLYDFGWEVGSNYVYELEWEGRRVLVAHPGVGAAMAAGYTEELIAMGVERFVACGGCGALEPEIGLGHPVVLTAAVRDEGTSYHYLPPGREAAPSAAVTADIARVLERHKVPFRFGKAWTTDAPYRETPARRALRVAEGCSVVEMEAAAFFAVAQFRGAAFGQVVYGGDLVVPEGWDNRAWQERRSDRELLFWLAVEAVLE